MVSGLVVLAHKVSEVKKYQKTKIYKNYFYFFAWHPLTDLVQYQYPYDSLGTGTMTLKNLA